MPKVPRLSRRAGLPLSALRRVACMTKDGRIRADGVIRGFDVFRIKSPEESKAPEDLYAPVATIPGGQAFKAPDPACNLLK